MLEIADRTIYAFHLAQEKALSDSTNRAYLASSHSDGMKGMVRGPREEFIQTAIIVYACNQKHDREGNILEETAPRHTHVIFTDKPHDYGL